MRTSKDVSWMTHSSNLHAVSSIEIRVVNVTLTRCHQIKSRGIRIILSGKNLLLCFRWGQEHGVRNMRWGHGHGVRNMISFESKSKESGVGLQE